MHASVGLLHLHGCACRSEISFAVQARNLVSLQMDNQLTTASGYLRLYLFNSDKLTDEEKIKLTKLISYIVSVYVPSFIMIHLKPKACDGPFLTLFQRDLLFAYREINGKVADVVLKYFGCLQKTLH